MPDSADSLRLEKLGIRQDLDALITRLDKEYAVNNLRLVQIEKVATDLAVIVSGQGEKVGLSEKVRGIEGIFKHVYAIWVLMIGAILDFISRHFGR